MHPKYFQFELVTVGSDENYFYANQYNFSAGLPDYRKDQISSDSSCGKVRIGKL